MGIKYPMLSEKCIQIIQKSNTVVFIVDKETTKEAIKKEIEKKFNVKVSKINTLNTLDGKKKAYVRIKEGKAEDIAAKYGLI
ncbi:MAG: 50S ribosomal protein L23 [Candidatus Micrarchaeota archaeon]|nr:50S ribosomal protein L23 [Candidatus Micrarchaeota archaeon]